MAHLGTELVDGLGPGSVREYLQIANEKYGMTKQDALMLGSAAIDFDVSQVVDIVKGIHGTIPKKLFGEVELETEK